jgi:DNA-binding MarR family transcriptional regulator
MKSLECDIDLNSSFKRIHYSRLPIEVLCDKRLRSLEVRVFAVLAARVWQGAVATIGKRLIARLACCSESSVLRALGNLEAAGHIRRFPFQPGKRAFYELLSPVFGKKQRANYVNSSFKRIHYSRVPIEVLCDKRLRSLEVRVLAVLAARVWQGAVATMGKRLIARLACCSESSVLRALRNLESAGHIRRFPFQPGKRAFYELLSPVFGKKQRANYEDVIVGPHGRARLATVRTK